MRESRDFYEQMDKIQSTTKEELERISEGIIALAEETGQQFTHIAIGCDRCGKIEQMQVSNPPNMDKEEAKLFSQAMFYASKLESGRKGWYTSVGRDLCPACCKLEGKEPGYVETGGEIDVTVQKREGTHEQSEG